MGNTVLKMPLTEADAERKQWLGAQKLIDALGEFPDALLDLQELRFHVNGAEFVVVAYRDAEALAKKAPLPNFDPVAVSLTWDELRSQPGAGALEGAVRGAAWAILLATPRLLSGPPPMGEDKVDNRVHLFDGGQLQEV